NLLAAPIDPLVEVALPVEQPDGDERQPQIARGLAMIARQDAETAGVDREALVEAVLGAEVRDEIVLADAGPLVGLRPLLEVRVELGHDLAVRADEVLVLGRMLEDRLIDAAQEQLGVVIGAQPERLVEPAEQPARRRIPAEPEVRGDLLEAPDRLGQARVNLQREMNLQRENHVSHASVPSKPAILATDCPYADRCRGPARPLQATCGPRAAGTAAQARQRC